MLSRREFVQSLALAAVASSGAAEAADLLLPKSFTPAAPKALGDEKLLATEIPQTALQELIKAQHSGRLFVTRGVHSWSNHQSAVNLSLHDRLELYGVTRETLTDALKDEARAGRKPTGIQLNKDHIVDLLPLVTDASWAPVTHRKGLPTCCGLQLLVSENQPSTFLYVELLIQGGTSHE